MEVASPVDGLLLDKNIIQDVLEGHEGSLVI
jgi:hypothetical protein